MQGALGHGHPDPVARADALADEQLAGRRDEGAQMLMGQHIVLIDEGGRGGIPGDRCVDGFQQGGFHPYRPGIRCG